MPTTNRPFRDENDIANISQFLLDTYRLNQRLHNWDVRRWQGRVYHTDHDEYCEYLNRLPQLVRIWETDTQQIVGAVIPEYDGGIFLQIHPDYRELEVEMIDWAEARHLQQTDHQTLWLDMWSYDYDEYRNDLLSERGYIRTEAYDVMRRRDMTKSVPPIKLPAAYRVRAMRHHTEDWEGLAQLLNAAFNRDYHKAADYEHFQTSPYYQAEFDIVVEAPDGTLVANAGFMVHDDESFALVEPVCTHPEHQGKGLSGSAIAEGLRRVAEQGIRHSYIGAWYSNPVSNHLYQKMGFTGGTKHYLWRLESG